MGVKLLFSSGETAKRAIESLLLKIHNPFAESSLSQASQFISQSAQSQTVSIPSDPFLIADSLQSTLNELNSMLETISLINESCNVALETLSDMLTFDKIDENKLVMELTEENPWDLVNETTKPFQINAKDANVEMKSICKDSDTQWCNKYSVRVDKFKLHQVIRNLISNALKFTPALGHVTVLVEMLCCPSKSTSIDSNSNDSLECNEYKTNAGCVRISVVDTGHGISKENQGKLFGQYVQFNAASLQQGKGSGLGLWISKSNTINIVFVLWF
jgi:signal transduction histidine kinase